MESAEAISVAIRFRPLSDVERAEGSPWKVHGNNIQLFDSRGNVTSDYAFDHVFAGNSTSEEVFQSRACEIAKAAVDGFNGTIFAYGQTSSGKTFTMRGVSACEGIIPLSVRQVFDSIAQTSGNREFLLRVSYLEIYNEEINDLLAPDNKKLQIHENLERGVFVAGLHEEVVMSTEQVLQLLDSGEVNRSIGETRMNDKSSRSHAIFRMVIESREIPEEGAADGGTDAVLVSTLNLVDLAGSERVAKTGAEGNRLKEGGHINKSLMVLGTVINKLSEGADRNGAHIPYRDSKLTRILQPALGGNTKTAIICCATPATRHEDETHGTLRFALRAKRITNCAQVNEILTDTALLKRQKKEIEDLRRKLEASHSPEMEQEIMKLRNAMLKMESEKEVIALQLQEERAAHSQKEQMIKEQERKIENLSTLVIKTAAAGDRQNDKRFKKGNRRETWCPPARMDSSPAGGKESQQGGPAWMALRRRAAGPIEEDEDDDEDGKEGKAREGKVLEVRGGGKRRISSVQKLAALWEKSRPEEAENVKKEEEVDAQGFQDGQAFVKAEGFGSGASLQEANARDGLKKRRFAPCLDDKENVLREISDMDNSPVAKKPLRGVKISSSLSAQWSDGLAKQLAEKDALIAQLQAQVSTYQAKGAEGSARGSADAATTVMGQRSALGSRAEAVAGEEEKCDTESEASTGQERRCKSLGSPAVLVNKLQARVKAMEMEKTYMQRELDFLSKQAKEQADTTHKDQQQLQDELDECRRQLEEAQQQATEARAAAEAATAAASAASAAAVMSAPTPPCETCSSLQQALATANEQLYETEQLLQQATAAAAAAKPPPFGTPSTAAAEQQLLEKQKELEAAAYETYELKKRIEDLEANVREVERVLLEVSEEKDSRDEEIYRLNALLAEERSRGPENSQEGGCLSSEGEQELLRLREMVEGREKQLVSLQEAVRRLQLDVTEALGDPAAVPTSATSCHADSLKDGDHCAAGKAVAGEMRDLCAAVGRLILAFSESSNEKDHLALQLRQGREREAASERKLAEARTAAAEGGRDLVQSQQKEGQEVAALVTRLQSELEEAGRKVEEAMGARDMVELKMLTARREADAREAQSRRELVDLQEKRSALEREVEWEREEKRKWEGRVVESEKEVRRAVGEKREVELELERVKGEMESVSEKLVEKERELAALQVELQLVVKEKDAVSERAEQIASELEAAKASVSEAQLQFEACKQQHAEELAETRKDLVAARKEVGSLKGKPGAAERERDQLRKDIEKRKTKMCDLEAKLKAVQGEKMALQMDKANLEREVKGLKAQSSQMAKEMSKREQVEDRRKEVQAKAVQADKQLAALAGELEERERMVVSLEAALETAERERDELQLQLAAAREENEQLQAEVEAGQAELQEVLGDFEVAAAQTKELQEQKQVLGERCEALEKGKEEAVVAGRHSGEKVVALEARIEQAEEERRRLEAEISAAKIEHEELSAQHKATVQDLEKEREKAVGLEGDLKAEKEKSERLGRQADELVKVVSRLAAAEERIAELERQVATGEAQIVLLQQEMREAVDEAQAEGKAAATAVKVELEALQNKYTAQKGVWRKTFGEKKERVEILTVRLQHSEQQLMEVRRLLQCLQAEEWGDGAEENEKGNRKGSTSGWKGKKEVAEVLISVQDTSRKLVKDLEQTNRKLAEAERQRDELREVMEAKEEEWEKAEERERRLKQLELDVTLYKANQREHLAEIDRLENQVMECTCDARNKENSKAHSGSFGAGKGVHLSAAVGKNAASPSAKLVRQPLAERY